MFQNGPDANWWRTDATNALRSSHLARLFAFWKDRHQGDEIPSRADFKSEELLRFGGRIALIDVEHDPLRFRYRLVGTRITDALGRDSTGRYFDQLYDDEYYNRLETHFREIVTNRTAVRSFGTMAHSRKPFVSVEAIDLPLAERGRPVGMILRGVEFEI